MSWSYQDTMPRDIDKVRFYLGDTDSSDPLLTDEEIEFALSEAGTPKAAAALCCDRLATQYSRLADMSVGQLKISYSQKYQQYKAQATTMRSRSGVLALPTAGGIFVADKIAAEDDETRVTPSFTVDILDNPLVGHLESSEGTLQDETAD